MAGMVGTDAPDLMLFSLSKSLVMFVHVKDKPAQLSVIAHS